MQSIDRGHRSSQEPAHGMPGGGAAVDTSSPTRHVTVTCPIPCPPTYALLLYPASLLTCQWQHARCTKLRVVKTTLSGASSFLQACLPGLSADQEAMAVSSLWTATWSPWACRGVLAWAPLWPPVLWLLCGGRSVSAAFACLSPSLTPMGGALSHFLSLPSPSAFCSLGVWSDSLSYGLLTASPHPLLQHGDETIHDVPAGSEQSHVFPLSYSGLSNRLRDLGNIISQNQIYCL